MGNNEGTTSRTPSNPQQVNKGKQSSWPHSTPGGGGGPGSTGKGPVKQNGKLGKSF